MGKKSVRTVEQNLELIGWSEVNLRGFQMLARRNGGQVPKWAHWELSVNVHALVTAFVDIADPYEETHADQAK